MPRRQGTLFTAPTEELELSTGKGLNSEQRRALFRALDETGFLSITGPPGTGKTLTIHAIVETYVRQGGRVLVAALTNNAIDNVLERLVSDSDSLPRFLRIGTESAMRESLALRIEEHGEDARRYFSHTLGERTNGIESIQDELNGVSVFIGTAHSLMRSPWVTEGELFDLVILDEATQMTEPFAAALLSRGKKAILVGDEHQLGPICQSTFDPERETLPPSLAERGLRGLEQSLFERLNRQMERRDDHEGQVFLSRQYRMHPVIGDWASERFYEGRLETSDSVLARAERFKLAAAQEKWDVLKRVFDPAFPLAFLDVPATQGDLPNSCREEARVSALLVQALSRIGVTDVGCITPYRNQLALLRHELQRLGLNVECGTVDAFQGREKQVIILSTVRRDHLTDFLTSPRRLNVSVTRAQAKCVILGSRALLRENELLWSLVSHPRCAREQASSADLEDEIGI
ncbi:MAG: AAA domain-containing protein [Candidatus Poribacteria bacterium]|nr:AAA domain-containing protein [Candidatus Poribacteria bacterium]